MNLFPWRKSAVKEASGPPINKSTYKNFVVKAIGFIAGQGAARGDFIEPEYNLDEIRRAADSDSYIKMSLMKYSYLMYKAGYTLRSENDAAVDYIKMRFRIMSFATSKPVDILFQEVADDLVKYSNAFLVKSRVDRLMPGVQAKGVFNEKPIGGYFRVDPSTIRIKRDKNGTVISYSQKTEDGQEKKFAPTEIIHMYLDKDSNNAFGTPRIIAALEDVKLLRRIEGNVISLIYRFAIPIYQWMIGLPESGFQATDKEIQEAQREIENMPMDGVIVTNEKTQIKAIGAEGQALDASNYLMYFERRVFTALGVSESQMGRGGAKQDADSMEAQAHDTVKYIQRVMSAFIENFILNEILLEGGFNPIFNESDIVEYVFDEISLETKVKVENHEMLKYQSNLIPFDEARKGIGKKANVDEGRLYTNMIETKAAVDQIRAKTEGSVEVAKIGAANRAATAQGNGKTKSAKPSGAATNANRPTNQHGTGSARIKENLEDDDTESEEDNDIPSLEIAESIELQEKARKASSHKKVFSSIYKKYENLRNDIADTDADLSLLFPIAKDSIMAEIRTHIHMASHDGVSKAVNDINKQSANHHLVPNVHILLDPLMEEAEETLKAILKDIEKRVKVNRDSVMVKSVFSALEYRLRFMLEFILPKVYWFSYVKTGAHYGIDKAYIQFSGSDDKHDHPSEINPQAFSVDEIPAYHSFCDCKVSFKAGDKD